MPSEEQAPQTPAQPVQETPKEPLFDEKGNLSAPPSAEYFPGGAERFYPEVDFGPAWKVPEIDVAFPAGDYIFVLGRVSPVYNEGDDPTIAVPAAVLNDIWVLKYLGTQEKPTSQPRIEVHDGKVMMPPKGGKISERYPNPVMYPKMAWRAKAFFSKFDCIGETDFGKGGDGKGEKFVDWKKVREKYGTMFRATLEYSGKGEKRYRNFNYESIQVVTGRRVEFIDMASIEDAHAAMKAQSETTQGKGGASPASADDYSF